MDFKSKMKEVIVTALVAEEVRRVIRNHRQAILDHLRDQAESGIDMKPVTLIAEKLMELVDLEEFHEQLPAKQRERMPLEEPMPLGTEELERVFLGEIKRQAAFLLE